MTDLEIGSTASAILARLQDAHIPLAPGWWPPAFGWWVLFFAMTIGGGITTHHYLKRRRQRRCPAWHALNELDALWDDYTQAHDAKLLLTGLSSLMRRVAISMEGRQAVSSLTNEAWLRWLDQQVSGQVFTQGVGRALADAPYQPNNISNANAEAVFDACEALLERNINRRPVKRQSHKRNASI